jgi:hypothetical protein
LNRGLLIGGLGIILLVSPFFVHFHLFLPPWTTWDDQYIIEEGESKGISLRLIWGTVIIGKIVISEGGNGVFFLVDGTESTIVSKILVNEMYNFGFQASNGANYRLILENINVPLVEETVRCIIQVYWYIHFFMISGFLILAIGVILGVKDSRKSNKPDIYSSKKIFGKKDKLIMKKCSRCGFLNQIELVTCNKCGFSLFFAEEIDERSK